MESNFHLIFGQREREREQVVERKEKRKTSTCQKENKSKEEQHNNNNNQNTNSLKIEIKPQPRDCCFLVELNVNQVRLRTIRLPVRVGIIITKLFYSVTRFCSTQ